MSRRHEGHGTRESAHDDERESAREDEREGAREGDRERDRDSERADGGRPERSLWTHGHRKSWNEWHDGDPDDVENDPSREDLRGLLPYEDPSREDQRGTRAHDMHPPEFGGGEGGYGERHPWFPSQEFRRDESERRSEYGGAPFARGQELGLEGEDPSMPRGPVGSPGSYGRQSTSASSSTYGGRTAYRPESAGYRDAPVAWGSVRERQPTRGDEIARDRWVRGSVPGPTGRGPFVGRGPKGYRRSDVRIQEDLSDRLMEDAGIDASDVEIAVAEGEITLTGSIDSRDAKWRMEALAEAIAGVKAVQNNVRVRRGPPGGSS